MEDKKVSITKQFMMRNLGIHDFILNMLFHGYNILKDLQLDNEKHN